MTLKELAKIAGVSISTVSKALNDSPEIGKRTKQKITDLAKLYNYVPNKMAITLKTGKTKTIGVIVPSIKNNFFARVIAGIEEVLNANNYNIVISITNESKEKEAAIIKTLSNGVVDGFIISVAEETQISQEIDHFLHTKKNNKPVVLFDRIINTLNFDKVMADDNAVVFNTTKDLMSKGKTGIALVSAISNLSVGKSRKQGYLDAIKNNLDAIVIEADVNTIEAQIKTLLNSKKIDAIIALDEDASLLALKVANRKKLNIPNDLVIIGFAPSKLAKHLTPQLTTINQHGVTIGRTSAQLLIDKLKDTSLPPQRIIINSTIDHRETT